MEALTSLDDTLYKIIQGGTFKCEPPKKFVTFCNLTKPNEFLLHNGIHLMLFLV